MIAIREMNYDDLFQVIPIEKENFSVPWTMNGFFSWLLREDSCFLVAVDTEVEYHHVPDDPISDSQTVSDIPDCSDSDCSDLDCSDPDDIEYKVVGYCGLILTPPEGDVTNVCVAADYRHQGIARLLMHGLEQKAREHHIDTIHLEVRESNTAARRLYQSLGYREDGIRPRYYEAPVEHAVLMTLSDF